MKLSKSMIVATVLATCLTHAPLASAIIIGQVDNFEDGTTQGWTVGVPHPAPPANFPDGGPLGAGDNFLRLTSLGGAGPGNRLAVFSPARWTGDYTTAGIAEIDMDLRNLGTTELSIRLYLENPSAVALTSLILLPAGGGWTHVEFAVDALSLNDLIGDVDTLLANVTRMRIVHSPDVELRVDSVAAMLGVDNIRALPEPSAIAFAVPEPSALSLLGLGLAGLFAWEKRRGFSGKAPTRSSRK